MPTVLLVVISDGVVVRRRATVDYGGNSRILPPAKLLLQPLRKELLTTLRLSPGHILSCDQIIQSLSTNFRTGDIGRNLNTDPVVRHRLRAERLPSEQLRLVLMHSTVII